MADPPILTPKLTPREPMVQSPVPEGPSQEHQNGRQAELTAAFQNLWDDVAIGVRI